MAVRMRGNSANFKNYLLFENNDINVQRYEKLLGQPKLMNPLICAQSGVANDTLNKDGKQ